MAVALNKTNWFPDPELADENGLVAVGGDLSVARLLAAYRQSMFPWTVDPITWWSPDPRGIIELDRFHVSQSLARVLRQGRFSVTVDQAFGELTSSRADSSVVFMLTILSSSSVGFVTGV